MKDEEEENQKDEHEGPVSISALAAGSFDAVEESLHTVMLQQEHTQYTQGLTV